MMNPNTETTTLTPIVQWTPAHEEILKEWKAKAFAYLWLQNNSCYFYLRIHNWLAYIIIIISSISSATLFSMSATGERASTINSSIPFGVIEYTVGGLSLLSAILTGVIRQLKPGEMYQQHAAIAKRYHNLIRNIDACLSLTSTLRPNPAMFIERAGAELDNLANTQLEPPLRVIRSFEAIYGPLERVLYGEDIIELWKITYETNKLEQKMRKRMITTPSSIGPDRNTIQHPNLNIDINESFNEGMDGSVKVRLTPAPRESLESQQGGYLLNKFAMPFRTSVRLPAATTPPSSPFKD